MNVRLVLRASSDFITGLQMQAVAKRLLLVLCMLAVVTAQLYNAAFAMPMNLSQSVPEQTSVSHEMHHVNHALPELVENCCTQPQSHPRSQCSHSNSHSSFFNGSANLDSGSPVASHGCDKQGDCAQSHCMSSVGFTASHYIFFVNSSVTTMLATDQLLLSQNSGSLYRPPIYR